MSKVAYLATDAQVATLAKDYVANADGAEKARGTYLRILVAHSLKELSKGSHKRHTQAESLAAVETAHAHLYAVVTEAVLTPDVAPDPDASKDERARRTKERNRRTTFARTSKSALAGFVKAGGRLITLAPESVTRDALTKFTRAARAGPAALPDRVRSTVEKLENLMQQLVAEDADAAREIAEGLSTELQAYTMEQTVKPMKGKRKVGELTLHGEH